MSFVAKKQAPPQAVSSGHCFIWHYKVSAKLAPKPIHFSNFVISKTYTRACLKFFISLQMAQFEVNFVPKMLM